MARRPFTVAELELAKKMRAEGATYRTIGDAVGHYHTTVAYNLCENQRRKKKERAKAEFAKGSAEWKEKRRKRHKEWSKKNKERLREYDRKRASTPEGRARNAIAKAKYEGKKKGYKGILTPYQEIADQFTGKCQLCGVPEQECKKRLFVDHDHETGEFRGWLCCRCNALAGFLDTVPDLVEKFHKEYRYPSHGVDL